MNWLNTLLTGAGFMPHGMCIRWTTPLVGLHVVSDVFITAAYTMIPLMLAYVAIKRRDFKYTPVFWLFASFIICCGLTHAIGAWNFFHTAYWLEGFVLALTAFVSVGTAFALLPLLPEIINLRTGKDLAQLQAGIEIVLSILRSRQSLIVSDSQKEGLEEFQAAIEDIKQLARSPNG